MRGEARSSRRPLGTAGARAIAAAVALSTVVLCAAGPGRAQEASLEYPIKATFLVRFASYVTWPDNAFIATRSPLRICVIGEDPFGALLDDLTREEQIGGRSIVVLRLPVLERGSGCHVAYVGRIADRRVGDMMAAVRGEPVLFVTDSANTAERGAIHFAVAGDRVRFHVDERAAAQNELALSSRLLDVAMSVQRRDRS
jgi:hypothetical protein